MEIAVALWIFCGIGAGIVAGQRGGNGCLWFGLGAIFGPFGRAFSFASGSDRSCPFCRKRVHPEAVKCPHCQSDIPVQCVEQGQPQLQNRSYSVPLAAFALLAVIAVGAYMMSSNHEPRSGMEGTTQTTTGAVIENDVSVGGSHYVTISAQGREWKCYTDQSVPLGHEATIVGTVTVWGDGVGGSLRPCRIVK